MARRWNLEQQVFMLSLLSNTGVLFRGRVERIERHLHTLIKDALRVLRGRMGRWEIVWGPAVFQAPLSRTADNVMYVAHKKAEENHSPQLVVAIAGTNSLSLFDCLIEDFAVASQVKWCGEKAPANAKVSLGTFIGFSILRRLWPGHHVPGHPHRIRDFLATQTKAAPVQVTVAGHSLGGALSPALALWLAETRGKWDPDKKACLACWPSAGPTPGNQEFARYYKKQLKTQTKRIFNTLDVIPCAWAISDLKRAPNLYDPPISDPLLNDIAQIVIDVVKDGDYAHPGTPAPFDGKFNKHLFRRRRSALANFLIQALYQHTLGYAPLMGIRIPHLIAKPLRKAFDFERAARSAEATLRRRWAR